MCQESNHLENPAPTLKACEVSPFFSPNKQLLESKLVSDCSFPTYTLHSFLIRSSETPIGWLNMSFLCTVTSISNTCLKSNTLFPNKREVLEAVCGIFCQYWCYFGYRLHAVPIEVCQPKKGDLFFK